MAILVTGGTGYIGSHTCVEMLESGLDVVILDNLSNSKIEVVHRIEKITGRRPVFHKGDLLDAEGLERLFASHSFEAVIHFAGFKAVGESVERPLHYYRNNLIGTLNLLEAMRIAEVHRMVFSSSATVYDPGNASPLKEEMVCGASNPYGRTKWMIEEMLRDFQQAHPQWEIALLRYFNPIGAHSSGLIGEDPNGIPNNLMPYITQVAVGKRPHLTVFGKDYPTPDGTGVRDYIHVVDLARGHLRALEQMRGKGRCRAFNLGTGIGYSVLDVVETFQSVSGVEIPYRIGPRRPGDIAICYADPSRAAVELEWEATHDLGDMCRDSWHWQQKNPKGY